MEIFVTYHKWLYWISTTPPPHSGL